MKRIHNLKRTIALFLAMLMAATSTAFADWDSFQGNDDNNGTTEIGITSRAPSTTTVNLPNDGATTGLDVEPLIFGSRIYAFHNGGNNGATVTAVDATDGSQLWTTVVGPEAKDISQIATPVISEDGTTMYGAYTYTDNIFKGITPTVTVDGEPIETLTDVSVPNGSTIKAVYQNVNLPGTYGNIQVSTGMASPSSEKGKILTGTVTLKNNSTETSFSGDSYGTYAYSIYYTDGDPIVSGDYTVEVSVTNNTGAVQTWSSFQFLINYWQAFKVEHIDQNKVYVPIVDDDGNITNEPAADEVYAENLKISGAGQASTPFTLANGKLYFGIFDGDRAYYQYDTATNTSVKFVPGNNNQFYYAGALVVGNKVFFGSENGILYMLSTDSFTTIGDPLELAGATRIRSSICYDSEYKTIYLTSQNGLLWKVELSDSGFASEPKSTSIAQGDISNSSSTPVVSKSGLIYVSVYGYNTDFVGEGYIVATSRNSFTENNKIYIGDTVQCSPVVYWDGTNNTDYIYFTTNTGSGSGYCYQCKYTVSDGTGKIWSVTPESGGNGYAVQGFAMGLYKEEDEEGELLEVPFDVFGNDSNQIIIVK